jgi:hypothetical protein
MATKLWIGEKTWDEETQAWSVALTHQVAAPTFPHDDPLEPHANWRYVNYAAWQGMAEECDLVAWLTHPQTGLLHTSDLPRSLTEADYRVVNEAYLLRSVFNEDQPGWAFEPTEEDQLAIGKLPMQPAYDEY